MFRIAELGDNRELHTSRHFVRAPRQNGIDNSRGGQETISETRSQFFVGETTFLGSRLMLQTTGH